jgi:hypothetical protein
VLADDIRNHGGFFIHRGGKMHVEEIQKNAEIIKKQGQLWRDPAARRRFEEESGLKPIITGDSLEVEAQHQSGTTKEYHEKFQEWAFTQ